MSKDTGFQVLLFCFVLMVHRRRREIISFSRYRSFRQQTSGQMVETLAFSSDWILPVQHRSRLWSVQRHSRSTSHRWSVHCVDEWIALRHPIRDENDPFPIHVDVFIHSVVAWFSSFDFQQPNLSDSSQPLRCRQSVLHHRLPRLDNDQQWEMSWTIHQHLWARNDHSDKASLRAT